ncbi:MAG: PDZ domain-containing protein [Clostridia bacterium]|nr:PDZ domain-containing protein [Clostridia bacterium]MBR5977168.1 PDZ domain-containing protein [Clostridia bacterium]MBR5992030.1 PDZ domain-containing protein [Clostridia bacterium]
MSKKIPLGTALAILFVVMAATIAITMKVSMGIYNNLINDLSGRSAMYDGIAEVDKLTREKFDGTIDSESVYSGLAAGFINGLDDPASFYLTPAEYEVYNNKLLGKMSGTGLNAAYNTETNQLLVTSVAKNSPAEAAGLSVGDVITKIADIDVDYENYSELVLNLEGQKLSNVNVTYSHEGQINTVNLVMGYSLQSVTYRNIGTIGIISITGFYENAIAQFKDAIKALDEAGCKSLVIDVRNCDEGTIEYATKVLDILVPVATEGTAAMATIVNSEGKTIKTFPSDSESISIPILVLINGGTKGPAELFACDLRDFGKAQLIGTKTKGVCTMQQLFRLSNGGAVVLTVANVLPYTSESINGTGVNPDYIIKLTAEQTAQIGIMPDAEDPQMQQAFQLLSGDAADAGADEG